ncbi:hypothetical protein FQA39_LY04216 [Lamprigera yunnana]|nr:hypothetical protein FQA39_LY04216 [Lamprigera yunnana]
MGELSKHSSKRNQNGQKSELDLNYDGNVVNVKNVTPPGDWAYGNLKEPEPSVASATESEAEASAVEEDACDKLEQIDVHAENEKGTQDHHHTDKEASNKNAKTVEKNYAAAKFSQKTKNQQSQADTLAQQVVLILEESVALRKTSV